MDAELIRDLSLLLVSVAGAVYLVQVLRSFSYMSVKELRRRALAGSRPAQRVLAAREHGLRLWVVLWAVLAALIVVAINVINYLLPAWAAILAGSGLFVAIFFVLPWSQWASRGLGPAARVGPSLASTLKALQSFFDLFRPFKLGQKISKEAPFYIHSKEHLIDVMKSLKSQTSQKQVIADLELAIAVLRFNTKKVKAFMSPITAIKTVKFDQKLSPQTINNLHKSKHSVFPALGAKGKYVGLLYFRDIQSPASQPQAVQDVMSTQLCYVNLNMPLSEVVNAFLKTQQRSFLVVNNSQTIEGLISIDDVLHCYFAEEPQRDFQHYDDLGSVASFQVNHLSTKKPKPKEE